MANTEDRDLPLYVHDKVTTPPTKPAGHRRIIDLEPSTVPQDTDELVIQRGSQTFRIPRSALLGESSSAFAYASIYTADGDASPALSQTPGTTPVLYTGFETNGEANDATPDQGSSVIRIGTTGVYLVTAQFSFSGGASAVFNFEVMITSDSPSTATGQKATRKLGVGGDVGSCSLTGLVSLSANDEVGIHVDGTAGEALNTHQSQFTLTRVG